MPKNTKAAAAEESTPVTRTSTRATVPDGTIQELEVRPIREWQIQSLSEKKQASSWYDTEKLQHLLERYAGGNNVEVLAAIDSSESLQAQLAQVEAKEKQHILPLNINALTKELGQNTNHWVGLYITHNGVDALSGIKKVMVDYVDPMGHAINSDLKNYIEECLASLSLSAEIKEPLLGNPIQYAKQISEVELQGNTDDCGPMLVYIMACLSRSLGDNLPKFTNEVTSHSFGSFLREGFDGDRDFRHIYNSTVDRGHHDQEGPESKEPDISAGDTQSDALIASILATDGTPNDSEDRPILPQARTSLGMKSIDSSKAAAAEEPTSVIKTSERSLAVGADTEARDKDEWTPLHLAAQEGKSEVVDRLLAAGADMEARDNQKWTPLHLAAQEGKSEVVDRLLAAGADMEAREEDKWTPLHLAAQEGKSEVVDRLLAAGADMEARDNQKWTPLHLAALNGHEQVLERLLAAGADMEAREEDKWTPLHLAAQEGKSEVVDRLLAAGADMEARMHVGATPLHLAAEKGNEQVLDRLLAAGADMDAKINTEFTPLHLAAQNGHEQVLDRLLAAGADMETRTNIECTPLHLAAENGHEQVLERLLAAGADMEARMHVGATPLHLAAEKGNEQVLDRLLASGADMDALSNLGETPLYMAVNQDKVNVAKILLNAGVDRELQHQKHGSPLHCAVQNSNAKMVSLLLDNGANIEALRADGMSALCLAAINGYKGIVELLLEHGADINAIDQFGRTALYFALNEGWDDIVDLLLTQGARISDLNGKGLIHVAVSEGDIKVVKKLFSHISYASEDEEQIRVAINLADSEGNTALHIATAEGHTNIIKFLLKKGIDSSVINNKGLTAFNLASELAANPDDPSEYKSDIRIMHMQDIVLLFNLVAEVKSRYSSNLEMQSLYLEIIYDENTNINSLDELESKYLKIFKLKEAYRADDKLPKLIDDEAVREQSFDDYYVKLQMILRDSAKQQGVAGRTELVSGEKKPVEIADIFSSLDSEHPESSRLLILGSAGVGKSTLMHYVSYRWGRGDLWNDRYDFVFRIKLKNLLKGGYWKDMEDGDNSREELLVKFIRLCLPEGIRGEFDKKTISLVLQEHNDRILFLLDGYDEVADLVIESETRAQLMFNYVMSCRNVILTSRPNAVRDSLKSKFERVVENIGLDDDGIEQYIDNAFAIEDRVHSVHSDHESGGTMGILGGGAVRRVSMVATDVDLMTRRDLLSELKEFLEHNSMIRGICTIPINTALICLIWQDARDKFGENFTIGTLYQEVITWLGKRHLKNCNDNFRQKSIEAIDPEDVIGSDEIQSLKEVAYRGFTESKTLILSGKTIKQYTKSIWPSSMSVSQDSLDRIHKFGLLKIEQEGETLLQKTFSFIHLTFQEYLLALKFKEMLQDGVMVAIDDASVSMAGVTDVDSLEHQRTQTIGEFLAHHRNESRYLMSLKFLAASVEQMRLEANKPGATPKFMEQARLLVTCFWEAMNCNLNGVIDLNVEEKVKLLLHLLGQVRDFSDLAQDDQDVQVSVVSSRSVTSSQLSKVKIPNLKEMVEFVDDELLKDIDSWSQEVIASGYRSSAIDRLFDSNPNIDDLESFASKIDLIAASRYSMDALEIIVADLVEQIDGLDISQDADIDKKKELILEALVKLAHKDLSYELKEVILTKYLDVLKAAAKGLSVVKSLLDTVEQNIGELVIKLQLGNLLLNKLADLVSKQNMVGTSEATIPGRAEELERTQAADDPSEYELASEAEEPEQIEQAVHRQAVHRLDEVNKEYIIRIITVIASGQRKLVSSAYGHLAEMLKSDDLSIRSSVAYSIAELVSIDSSLAEQGFKTLLISLKHSQNGHDIGNLSIAICRIVKISPQIILPELDNIIAMLDDPESQTKRVGISLLVEYVEINNNVALSVYPKLQNLLTDSDWQIEEAAIEALGKIARHSGDFGIIRDIYQSLLLKLESSKSLTIKSLGDCAAGDPTLAAEVLEKIMPLFSECRESIMQALEQCVQVDNGLVDVVYEKVITELGYVIADMDRWQAIFSALEVCAKIKPELKADLYSRLQSNLDSEEVANLHMSSVLAECLKSDAVDIETLLNKLHESDSDKAAIIKTIMSLLERIDTVADVSRHQLNEDIDFSSKISQEKILSLYKIFNYQQVILECAEQIGFAEQIDSEDAAEGVFTRLMVTLQMHIPDISDEESFVEFMLFIDQRFDFLCDESRQVLFKEIYIKVLEFESQDSSGLQDVSRSLIVKFLQAGFTTSFDLNKCELIYDGHHYRVINDRSILEGEFCESAVTVASETGNPLARQIVTHQPLFVSTGSTIKPAASDVGYCVGLLSREELDYTSYDVSMCARSNHNGDLQDSFILLEQRLITGEYLYRKIYAEDGRIKVINGAINPADMGGVSGTAIRKAIFGEMSYYGSSSSSDARGATVERPIYCTRTARISDKDVVVSMSHELEGSDSIMEDDVDSIFALFNGRVGALLEKEDAGETKAGEEKASGSSAAIISWQEFKIMRNSTEHNKAEILQLTGSELQDFSRDDTSFATHVKLDNLDREFREKILVSAGILQSMVNEYKFAEAEKAEIASISANPYQDAFYKTLRMELNSSYLAATTIKSGWVQNNKKGDMGKFGSFMKEVSGVVPFVGPGVKIIGSVLKMADAKHQKSMIDNYATFVVDSAEMAQVAELIARMVVLSNLAIETKGQSMQAKIQDWLASATASFMTGDLKLLPEDLDAAVSMVQDKVIATVQSKISKAADVQAQAEEHLADKKEELMEAESDRLAGIKDPSEAAAKGKNDAKIVAQMIVGKIFAGKFEVGDLHAKAADISEFIGGEFRTMSDADIEALQANSLVDEDTATLVASEGESKEVDKGVKTPTLRVIKGSSLDKSVAVAPRVMSTTDEEMAKDIAEKSMNKLKLSLTKGDETLYSDNAKIEQDFTRELANALVNDHNDWIETARINLASRDKVIKKLANILEASCIVSNDDGSFKLSTEFMDDEDFFDRVLTVVTPTSTVNLTENLESPDSSSTLPVNSATEENTSSEIVGQIPPPVWCCIVSYVTGITYDNEMLNHPELLQIAASKYGSDALSKLIDLGMDKEVAEEILDNIQAQGAYQVFDILFGGPSSDRVEESTDSANECVTRDIAEKLIGSVVHSCMELSG